MDLFKNLHLNQELYPCKENCLSTLAKLFPNLETLILGAGWPRLSCFDVMPLVGLVKLQKLVISNGATFSGLLILGTLVQLEELNLQDQPFNLNDPDITKYLNTIIDLGFVENPLTPENFARFSYLHLFDKLTKLKRLHLKMPKGSI
ncbi:MAG: hypothetical protein HWD61_14440 [Parachlamydiaceae bacterium]|nr:MAG: hypothetical protein HWD61_14440 [Parachlamydiaceae bacterium]